jgi:hypothetical protein
MWKWISKKCMISTFINIILIKWKMFY